MPTFEAAIDIHASADALFDLTQDYARRLDWDPFLKEARLVDRAAVPAVGVRAWCVARTGLGMETEYVSFRRPHVVAVKMTRGPRILKSFAGSWRFKCLAPDLTRVVFRYHVAARPACLRRLLHPIMCLVFERDVAQRLAMLKRFAETSGLGAAR